MGVAAAAVVEEAMAAAPLASADAAWPGLGAPARIQCKVAQAPRGDAPVVAAAVAISGPATVASAGPVGAAAVVVWGPPRGLPPLGAAAPLAVVAVVVP